MFAAIIFLVFSRGLAMAWSESSITPHFDRIEINHKLDEEGEEQFVQLIAWSWCPSYTRFHCEGWRLLATWRRTPRGLRYMPQGKREWFEVNGEVTETWTRHDPERANQALYPVDCRQWK